jgi:hypothetical protein
MKVIAMSALATAPFLSLLNATDVGHCITECSGQASQASSDCLTSLDDCSGVFGTEEYLQCRDEYHAASSYCYNQVYMDTYYSCMADCQAC